MEGTFNRDISTSNNSLSILSLQDVQDRYKRVFITFLINISIINSKIYFIKISWNDLFIYIYYKTKYCKINFEDFW